MANLLSTADKLAALDRSGLDLDTDRCLHTTDRFNTCTLCFEVCPAGAIGAGTPPTFDASLCQHCYACLAVCPVDAYQGTGNVKSLLLTATRLDTEKLELYCQHNRHAHHTNPEADAAVRVRGCLAGLGSGAYLSLRCQGIKSVYVRKDACKNCQWDSLSSMIDDQVTQAQHLLDLWGYADAVNLSEEQTLDEREDESMIWDADNPPLSRRGLFKMLSHQGQEAFAHIAINAEETGKQRASHNQLRTVQAVNTLDKELVQEPGSILEDMGLFTITVADDCTACGSCSQACPTNALTFKIREEDETTFYQLEFTAAFCIGCEACLHTCYPEAISINAAPSFDEVFGVPELSILRQGELTQCQKCNHTFAPKADEHLCPLCEFRIKNPLGSQIPPGLLKQMSTVQGED